MTRHVRGRSGYTLIEVMTAIGIVGIVLAAALPHLDPRRQDINTTLQTVIGDLRVARSKAISSGVHFSFNRLDNTHYQLRRHKETGPNEWPVDTIIKTISLPSAVQFWLWPSVLEFNTRGMLVTPNYPATGILGDTSTSTWHAVSIWPSGQVNSDW